MISEVMCKVVPLIFKDLIIITSLKMRGIILYITSEIIDKNMFCCVVIIKFNRGMLFLYTKVNNGKEVIIIFLMIYEHVFL